MKMNTFTRANKIHFILIFGSPVGEIASAPNHFTPGIYLCHDSGAHPRRTFVRKSEYISLFQTKPAISRFSVNGGQFKLPIFSNPFSHSIPSINRFLQGGVSAPVFLGSSDMRREQAPALRSCFLKVFEDAKGTFFKKPPAVGLWHGVLSPIPKISHANIFS